MPTVKNVTHAGPVGGGWPVDLDNGVVLRPGSSASVGTDATWPRVNALIASGELSLTDAVNPVVAPLVPGLQGLLNTLDVQRLSNWQQFNKVVGGVSAPVSAGTYVMTQSSTGVVAVTAGSAAAAQTYLDPADYLIGTRTLKLRLRALIGFNTVAPANGTWTFDLRPAGLPGGNTSQSATLPALGAAVAGSAVAFVNPGAAMQKGDVEFDFPAAGFYALCLTNTVGYGNANGAPIVMASLAWRAV